MSTHESINTQEQLWDAETSQSLSILFKETDGGILSTINKIHYAPNNIRYSRKTLQEHLQQKNYLQAIEEWIRIIASVRKQSKQDFIRTWLDQYKHLDKTIVALDTQNISIPTLQYIQRILNQEIRHEKDIYKRLQMTYLLSYIKRSLITDQYDWDITDYDMLYRILQPGDILLLNCKSGESSANSRLGASLIYSHRSDTDNRTHSIIIWRKSWQTPFMVHSTMKKQADGKGWVEERNFCEYIESFESADILILEPPLINKEKSIAYAYEKIRMETGYDYGAAAARWSNDLVEHSAVLHTLVPDKMTVDHEELVNCVELIAEWLGIPRIKNIAFPEEFLEEELLKPVYMGTMKKT